MNKKVIIIIFIFILIIIGASTAIYLFMNKPSDEVPKEEQKDNEETAEEEKVEDEIPVDAKCREDIEDSFYQFEDTPIKGSDILSNLKNVASQFIRTIKQHIFKERFSIESNFITNKTQLDPNKTYYVGKRKVSNTLSQPMYGGKNNCSEYPDVVYKEKPEVIDPNIPASSCTGYDCAIEGQKCLPGTPGSSGKTWVCTNKKWVEVPTINTVSKSDWELVKSDFYGPYGGDWSDSNVNTKPYNLDQAQSYAESRGYDGITYKPLPGSDTGFNQFFMWKSSSSNLNNGGSSPGWNVYKKKFVDPSIPASKCTGSDCTIEGQKCLPGTEGASGKTWVCTNKKWVEVPNAITNSDPCSPYGDNSTNVSQECYNKIWKDNGCITPPATIGDWHKSQTKAGLIADSNAWATLITDTHRNGCYTTDRTKWPGYTAPIEVNESSCRYDVNYYTENWEACYKKGWTLDPSLWRYFDE